MRIYDTHHRKPRHSGAFAPNHRNMDSVVALLKERVPGYVPSKDEYNGLVEDVLANWKYIWNEAIVYNVLATIVYTNEPKKDFDWYDGLKLLHLIDFAAWQQWCDA